MHTYDAHMTSNGRMNERVRKLRGLESITITITSVVGDIGRGALQRFLSLQLLGGVFLSVMVCRS